jgi:hypothetical protein
MERIERSSVAYHATALPLSYIGEGHLQSLNLSAKLGARGGNRNPDLRVTGAALFHLSYSGVERVRRIELRYSGWRPDAQPIGDTRQNFGADGDNRNLFSGLEAQGTPYIPRPHRTIFNCQRTRGPARHTSTFLLPHGSQLDNFRLKSR